MNIILKKINFLFKIILTNVVTQNYKFMSENLNSNNIENDELNLNNEDSDYKDLLIRLKEIKSSLALLEKTIFK